MQVAMMFIQKEAITLRYGSQTESGRMLIIAFHCEWLPIFLTLIPFYWEKPRKLV